MIIKKGYKSHYCFVVQLKDELMESGFTKEQIKTLEGVFFGDYKNDYYSEYEVRYYGEVPEDKWWQRLNLVWVVPLFLIIAPIRYVVYGDYRYHPNTKFGRAIKFLVGDNK